MIQSSYFIKHSILILSCVGILSACGGGSGGGNLPSEDTSAPKVVSITPTNNQTDVATSELISISLDEAIINDNTINITVEQVDDIDNTIAFIAMKNIIEYNDKTFTLTFSPVNTFIERLRYRVTISNIKDINKNKLSTQIWYFSTKTPPTVESLSPDITDNPIPKSTNEFIIYFSEPMDESTINKGITLTKKGITDILVNLGFNYTDETITNGNTGNSVIKGKVVLSLPPNLILDPSGEYELSLLPTVTDKNGISISTAALPITKNYTVGSTTGIGNRPAAPVNSTASVLPGKTDITITWDSVAGATDYNVYVSKNNSAFSLLPLIHPYTTLSYVHAATLSDEYIYAVTAIINNNESKFSLTNKVASFSKLTPTDFTATADDGKVFLNWTINSSLSYTLEYKFNNGAFTTINFGTTTPYTHPSLTNGTVYTYRLTAKNIANGQSGSITKTATPLGLINFGVNDKVTVTAGNASIRIEWPDISSNPSFSHYNLYATEVPTSRTNTCSLIATNIKPTGTSTIIFTHDVNTIDACTNPLAWPVINNKTYTYSVSVVNKNGTEGLKISSFSVTPVVAPVVPVITAAIPGNGSVNLQWDGVIGLKYNVYVDGQLNTNTPLTFNSAVGSYTTSGLTNNTRYKFEVESLNSNNTPSLTKASIIKAPMPSIDVNSITTKSADNKITLTWTTNTITSSVTGTILYNVFLKKGQGTFSKVNSTIFPVIGKTNTYQTVVTRLTNNLSHQFEISAITAAGNESIVIQSGISYPVQGGSKISSSLSDRPPLLDVGLPTNNAQPAHVCSIKNGNIWCWGNNANGELGIGIQSFAEKPIRVGDVPVGSGLVANIQSDWESVTNGTNVTCGIRKDITNNTSLWCWGENANGKLGINNAITKKFSTPQLINKPIGTGEWLSVSSGVDHSCAILQTVNANNLYCWGSNGNGQLGDGTISVSAIKPNLVKGQNGSAAYNDWLEVSSGSNHTCGIRKDLLNQTTLWCWGSRTAGQLGDNNPTTTTISISYPNPVVTSKTDWTSISAGVNQSCAVGASDNSLFCWGAVSSGFIASPSFQHLPIQESPIANDWLKVFVGAFNTCGLKVNGKMTCWGDNYHGQLAIGSLILPTPNQITVTLPDVNWSEFALSYTSVCGLKNISDVSCWGNGYGHKLGSVSAETGFPSQTGYARNGDLNQPITNAWASVVASKYSGTETYALNGATNELYGWGEFARGPNSVQKSFEAIRVSIINWKEVSQGRGHTCGIKSSDETLWCWGRNSTNQLGSFITAGVQTGSIKTPTQIGTSKWLHISAGVDHTCGIKSVNDTKGALELWCWGDNSEGELGNVNAPGYGRTLGGQLAVGVTIPTGTQWNTVYAGYNRTCAITSTGKLYCWGDNSFGELGNGDSTVASSNTPLLVVQPVTGLASTTLWSKVSTGENNTCAITLSQNELYCWGAGVSYILGSTIINTVPRVTADSWIPIPIKDSKGVVEVGPWVDISVGGAHACALKSNQSLWCWGRNAIGQLGRRTTDLDNEISYTLTAKLIDFTVTGKLEQVEAGLGNKYKSVSAGPYYTCAIRSSADVKVNNTLECWGNNNNGQGGFIGTVWQTIPLPITLQ